MESVQSHAFGRVVLVGQGDHLANGCDSQTDCSNLDLGFVSVVIPLDYAGKAGDCPDSVSEGGALKVRLQSQRLDIMAPVLSV